MIELSTTGDMLIAVAATTSIAFAFVLPLLSLDIVARYIIAADRLYARRRAEVLYQVQKTISLEFKKHHQRIAEKAGRPYEETLERQRTEKVTFEDDMKDLIKDIFDKDSDIEILSIAGDEVEEKEYKKTQNETYLYLSLENGRRLAQVPLVKFCSILTKELEETEQGKGSRNKMCFVSDASGGLTPRLLSSMVEKIEIGKLIQPFWMKCLASTFQQKLVDKKDLENIMFALCKIDIHRISNNMTKDQTVLFFLPECCASLIPYLRLACEKHVFVYDDCVASLTRAVSSYSKNPSATYLPITRLFLEKSKQQELFMNLSKLPSSYAKAVEGWMVSVSMFLSIQEKIETPFVFRLDHLLDDTNAGKKLLEKLFEFITGSMPTSDIILKARSAVVEVMKLEKEYPYTLISEKNEATIKDCLSCEKRIPSLFIDSSFSMELDKKTK